MIILPDKSPVHKYSPVGDVEIDKTGDSWPWYIMLTAVGKGFNNFGSGSFGTRVSGSILSFFFLTLGQRYKSKHLWNLYWIIRS